MDDSLELAGYTTLQIKLPIKKLLKEFRDSIGHQETFTSSINKLLQFYPSKATVERLNKIKERYSIATYNEFFERLADEFEQLEKVSS